MKRTTLLPFAAAPFASVRSRATARSKVTISEVTRSRVLHYLTDLVEGPVDDPVVQETARRSGLVLRGTGGLIKVGKNAFGVSLGDAYALCFTSEPWSPAVPGDAKFGVRISDAEAFFQRLARVFGMHRPVSEAACAPVAYREGNVIRGLEADVPVGFLKDRDRFADQKEVRMLWRPLPLHAQVDAPFFLECPEVAELCIRI